MSPACGCGYFNPRSPRGGATRVAIIRCFLRFISIHAPHEGERPFPLYRAAAIRTISIHAPHEGERPTRPETADGNICISIHAPHEGERPGRRRRKSCSPSYFNPRSPRGGATDAIKIDIPAIGISIHAPHEGERLAGFGHSVRACNKISIHAPHEGERRDCRQPSPRQRGISIHAPHEGERPRRLSAAANPIRISIHAPHEGERLPYSLHTKRPPCDFNPRSPRGGATTSHSNGGRHITSFQSTLPTRGSDTLTIKNCPARKLFQSTLPTRGSDTLQQRKGT
mgnify:CR=1 FL=1